MNITIKATGCELSEGSRTFIEEKLSSVRKLMGKDQVESLLAFELEESIGVVRAGARYRADATLTVEGKVFRAESTADTLEGAVDRVRDELSRELARARGKGRSLFRRGGAHIKRILLGE